MRIRYASDIHLEINDEHPIPDFLRGSADEVMIFAGDTVMASALGEDCDDAFAHGHKRAFKALLDQVGGFGKVFFLLGNHEHYRGRFQSSAEVIRDFIYRGCGLSEEKYILLDDDAYPLGKDALLVGTTLWTNIRGDNPDAHRHVGGGMNDFRLISYGGGKKASKGLFTTYHAMQAHQRSLEFIKTVASGHPEKRIIVATHHAPSYRSTGRLGARSEIIDGYCSDLEDFILAHGNITDWIHGHTHVDVAYDIGQCRVTSNMRGYVRHKHDAAFTRDQFLAKSIEV